MTYLTILLLYICVTLNFFILELPVTNADCLDEQFLSKFLIIYNIHTELELVVSGYKFRLLLHIVKVLSKELGQICSV